MVSFWGSGHLLETCILPHSPVQGQALTGDNSSGPAKPVLGGQPVLLGVPYFETHPSCTPEPRSPPSAWLVKRLLFHCQSRGFSICPSGPDFW